jgi:phenylacetate-CoA ligase
VTDVRAWRAFYDGTRAEVAARAFERLRALLVHARDTVPFHAERMAAAGLVPERMTSPADLAPLPPLTRSDVVSRAAMLTSRAFADRDLARVTTGGTTSAPVPFVQDRAAIAAKDALARVLRERMGWKRGMRAGYLWGAAQDLPSGARGRLARWRDALKHRFVNRAVYLPAGDLSDEVLDAHIAALQRFRPTWLQGYPTATDLLARRLLARGERLHVPHVLLTAEPVLPAQRERIGRALGADVLAFYGSRETGWIASECRAEKRAHVNVAGVHLEATPDGRLLVTDLLNRGMPLIRYEIGDLGRLDAAPCPCGDPRPLLARLEGRTLDVFVLPSGRRVPGVIPDVRGLQQDALGIEDARMVQNDLRSLDVEWVAGPNFRPEHLEAFREHLDHVFFHELELRFTRVEAIPAEPNGKVRRCISRVPHDVPGAAP